MASCALYDHNHIKVVPTDSDIVEGLYEQDINGPKATQIVIHDLVPDFTKPHTAAMAMRQSANKHPLCHE